MDTSQALRVAKQQLAAAAGRRAAVAEVMARCELDRIAAEEIVIAAALPDRGERGHRFSA